MAIRLLTATKHNTAALVFKRHLGVDYDQRESPRDKAPWWTKHKAMAERAAPRQLSGFVQIDNAYLGGERNGGQPGRGSESKRPLVIAMELTEEGHPLYAVITPVSGFTSQVLTGWARLHLRPEADVQSDGLDAFRAVIEAGHAHTVIECEGGRAPTEARDMCKINTVRRPVLRSMPAQHPVRAHAIAVQ